MQLTETAACVAGHGAYKGTNYFVDETTGRCAADATSTTVWQLTVHAQIGHSSQLHSSSRTGSSLVGWRLEVLSLGKKMTDGTAQHGLELSARWCIVGEVSGTAQALDDPSGFFWPSSSFVEVLNLGRNVRTILHTKQLGQHRHPPSLPYTCLQIIERTNGPQYRVNLSFQSIFMN